MPCFKTNSAGLHCKKMHVLILGTIPLWTNSWRKLAYETATAAQASPASLTSETSKGTIVVDDNNERSGQLGAAMGRTVSDARHLDFLWTSDAATLRTEIKHGIIFIVSLSFSHFLFVVV